MAGPTSQQLQQLQSWAQHIARPEEELVARKGPGLLVVEADAEARQSWLDAVTSGLQTAGIPSQRLETAKGAPAWGPFRPWIPDTTSSEHSRREQLLTPEHAAASFAGAGDDQLLAWRLSRFEGVVDQVGGLPEGTLLVFSEAHRLDPDALDLLAYLLVATCEDRLSTSAEKSPIAHPGRRPILVIGSPALWQQLSQHRALAAVYEEKLLAPLTRSDRQQADWSAPTARPLPDEGLDTLLALGALRSAREQLLRELAGLSEGESGRQLLLKARLDLDLGDSKEAISAFERALSSTREPDLFGLGCLGLARAFLAQRREDDAALVLEQGMATAVPQGPLRSWLRLLRAELHLEAFELDEARAACNQAFSEAPDGDPLVRARIRTVQAHLAYEEGDEPECQRAFQSALAQAGASNSHQLRAEVLAAQGIYERSSGRLQGALESYDEAVEELERSGFLPQLATALESRARAREKRERPSDLLDAVTDLEQALRIWDRLGDATRLGSLLPRIREVSQRAGIGSKRPLKRSLTRYARRLHALEQVRLSGGAAFLPQYVNLEPLSTGAGAPDLPTELRNLYAVWDVTKAVHHQQDLGRLLPLILDVALRLTEAERGFILLRSADAWERQATDDLRFKDLRFEIARNLEQGEIEHPEECISTSIALEVVRSGRPVLTDNAADDHRFHGARSVFEQDLKSIMCAPLKAGGRVLGALYLDHPSQSQAFEAGDLRLVEAFTGQAAVAIENAHLRRVQQEQQSRLERQKASLELKLERDKEAEEQPVAEAEEPENDYSEIVGRSKPMLEVLSMVDRVADSQIPVLIHGESGTGKELIARAIHYNSSRRDGPFVTESCAAVTDQILESELFGYVKGAYTGATEDREGMFERAHRGTLFLDEIGEMSSKMQGELLRVLEEGEVRRVGGHQIIPVDVRLVSATNRDLLQMVEDGSFRRDLYYRVKVFGIDLPPLRERKEDVPLLVDHFLEIIAERTGEPKRPVDPEAMKELQAYHWPGNIRELRNAIERACTLSREDVITTDDLEPLATRTQALAGSDYFSLQMSDAKDKFARDYLKQKLEEFEGHVTNAAEASGLLRQSFHRLLRRYDIDPAEYRT